MPPIVTPFTEDVMDHFLLLSEKQVRKIIREYVEYAQNNYRSGN